MYSVLMSVYKRETAENLRVSVESMMTQTVPPDDFVLYCDGTLGKDLYREIDSLKNKYPLLNVIYSDVNSGLGKALAKGLKLCRYDIIARMDSDDIARPERMALELEAMDRHSADIVSGTVEEFSGTTDNITNIKRLPQTDILIKKYAKHRNPFNHPCVCFKKAAAVSVGGYEDCPYFEDYWLWARMLAHGCVGYNLPQSLLYMRGGEKMYSRRGGRGYTKAALAFRKKMKQKGYCSLADYILTCTAHILSGMMPNKMRMLFYSKILRK